MKTVFQSVVVAVALVAPVASFAQSSSTLARAQFREELVQLEKAGYHVGDGDQAHFPEAIMVVEAKVSATSSTTDIGGMSTTSESDSNVSTSDWNAMYSR